MSPVTGGFSIQFSPQLRDVAGKFARAERETLDLRRGQLQEGMRSLVGYLRQEAPKRTGEFARKIGFRTMVENGILVGQTYAAAPLNEWIQKGTRPHVIRPKNTQALRFFWPAAGGVVFFKQVNHPGTAANPYHERAYDLWLPTAKDTLRKMALSFVSFVTQ